MKEKLTRWFPPEINPVRKGWYHASLDEKHPKNVDGHASSFNWWWDGQFWRDAKTGDVSSVQKRWWRGRTSLD